MLNSYRKQHKNKTNWLLFSFPTFHFESLRLCTREKFGVNIEIHNSHFRRRTCCVREIWLSIWLFYIQIASLGLKRFPSIQIRENIRKSQIKISRSQVLNGIWFRPKVEILTFRSFRNGAFRRRMYAGQKKRTFPRREISQSPPAKGVVQSCTSLTKFSERRFSGRPFSAYVRRFVQRVFHARVNNALNRFAKIILDRLEKGPRPLKGGKSRIFVAKNFLFFSGTPQVPNWIIDTAPYEWSMERCEQKYYQSLSVGWQIKYKSLFASVVFTRST